MTAPNLQEPILNQPRSSAPADISGGGAHRLFLKAMKAVVGVVLVLLAWFAVHTACVLFTGLRDNVGVADVAVVLGNKVELNGRPSVRLQCRLDRASDLYRKGLVKHIIVSGGRGKEGYEEADVMKASLMKAGIPERSILADRAGYDTISTARQAKALMEKHGFGSALVISSYYHILRTKLAFWKVGIPNVYTAPAQMRLEWRDPYSIVREFFAFYYYFLAY